MANIHTMSLCLKVIKRAYISTPQSMTTGGSIHIYIIPCMNRSYHMKFHIAKSQNRRHRHICMYMHTISCFSTRTDEPAAAAPAGRLQDWPWARSTDWRCFYKTLLFPIYGSYQGEILTGVLELLDGLLPKMFFILWNYFTIYKKRNFVVTRN